MLTKKLLWFLNMYITSTLQPNIALSLHENVHNCTIKLPPPILDLPKITIELWTAQYFSRPPWSTF